MTSRKLCGTGGAMAARRKYIYDIPYSDLRKVSLMLDINSQWKNLVTPLGFSLSDLPRFERAPCNSPSEQMLTEWGQQNHTINELFCMLAKVKQLRAMSYLKEYVDPKYHYLLNEDDAGIDLDSKWSATEKLPKPPHPVEKPKRDPIEQTAYGSAFGNPQSSTSMHKSFSKQNGSQELENHFANKFKVETHNLNRPDSNSSLPLKDVLGGQSPSKNHFTPGAGSSMLPKPPLPDIQILEATSLKTPESEEQSFEDNTNLPSTQPSLSSDGAQKMWQHPPYQNRRSSDASSSKSRDAGISSFFDDSMLPCIHYEDIFAATDGFSREKILGRGGFGIVYEGFWKNTKVAIKRIKKQSNPGFTSLEEAKLQQSYAELRTLNKYRHDNILPLYGYSELDDGLCLIYQFMVNGSLEDRLLRKDGTAPLTWKQRLQIARGSACGIQFLHTCDKLIIHGDIKSANILLDANLEPKIGDFGLAREGPMSQGSHTVVNAVHGTQPYLPADYIKDRQLSPKVDTYSFGIVLFELATGLKAYDNNRRQKFLHAYVMDYDKMQYDKLRDPYVGNDEYNEAFLTFIETGCRCAAARKKSRPEMVEVMGCLEQKLEELQRKDQPASNDVGVDKTNESPQLNDMPKNVLPAPGSTDSSHAAENDALSPNNPPLNIPDVSILWIKRNT